MLRSLALLFVLLVSASTAWAAGGALDALASLPPKFRDGVLKISADNVKFTPTAWSVIARNAYEGGAIYNLEVAQSRIVSQKISFDLRTALSDSPMTLSKLKVDSDDAWKAGAKYATSKGHTLGSVSYALQQKGKNTTPVWSVWCYDTGGSYVGLLQILATTGATVSEE